MTTLSSISRFLSSSIRLQTHRTLQLSRFSTDTSAETVLNHLHRNGAKIERTLNSMRLNLDPKCVSQVLHRCDPTQSQLGLRFFIWAGTHQSYRHSYFMFAKACELYRIRENPSLIFEVLEAYSVEGCAVSVKMFKVLFNVCKEAKLADEALRVLRKMPEFGLSGDNVVYNVVIRLFCEKGEFDTAESLVKEMSAEGLYPDLITYMLMIQGFCALGRLDDACGLFGFMKENGCVPSVVGYSVLLEGFCKFGDMERALRLLEEMEKEDGDCSPNVVTYTTVIQCFCDKRRLAEALFVLDRMEARGCFPNQVTVSTLVTGLVNDDQIEQAYKLVGRVVESGSVTKTDCYSTFVVSLGRVGKHQEAEKVLRMMLGSKIKPNSLVCTVMLKKRCLEGLIVDAYNLFCELEKMECLSSIDSDSDTYYILLLGLCQQRLTVEAAELARIMLSKGIKLKDSYDDIVHEELVKFGDEKLVKQLTRK